MDKLDEFLASGICSGNGRHAVEKKNTRQTFPGPQNHYSFCNAIVLVRICSKFLVAWFSMQQLGWSKLGSVLCKHLTFPVPQDHHSFCKGNLARIWLKCLVIWFNVQQPGWGKLDSIKWWQQCYSIVCVSCKPQKAANQSCILKCILFIISQCHML